MSCTVPGTIQVGKYSVWMPPFLAVLDNDVQAGAPAETSVTWLQYFATGTSATTLANLDQIRRVMLERIDPVAFESGTYDSDDPTVECVKDWLDDNPDNPQKLQNWWSEKQLPGLAVLLIVRRNSKNNVKPLSPRKASLAISEKTGEQRCLIQRNSRMFHPRRLLERSDN